MSECSGDYVKWIYEWFGDCVSTTREYFGFYIGLLPTIIWIYALIPQIILNFKNHSAEAVSFFYYMVGLSGDIANLVGVILNHGLITQKFQATWGTIADGTVLLQFVWYHWIKPRITGQRIRDPGVETINTIPLVPFLVKASASALVYSASPDNRPVVGVNPYDKDHLLGTLLGWFCGISYVSGRIPQVVKNFQRKTTEGLSLTYWISSFCANSTYGISIFLKDSSLNYIWSQAPWLLSSWGCLPLDLTVLIQFCYYKRKNRKQVIADYITPEPSTEVESVTY